MSAHQLKAIAKTALGKVVPLSQVLTGLRYVKQTFDVKNGSALLKDQGEVFISSRGHSFFGSQKPLALVATPVDNNGAWARFGMGVADSRTPDAYEIIPWPDDISLVLVLDPHHVASQWLCFVPTPEVTAAIEDAESTVRHAQTTQQREPGTAA